jgi:predicted ATPase
MPKRITGITIEGYKSIRTAKVSLGAVNVLVGANGAGKSNFIAVLDLLGRIVDGRLAFEVGVRGGASALLYAGNNGTNRIRLHIEAEAESPESENAYEAVLVPGSNDELIFEREIIYFRDTSRFSSPYNESFGGGHRESKLDASPHVGSYVQSMLRGCRVFHFQDTSRDAPVKRLGWAASNDELLPDAENLAAFLLRLREREPGHYRRIRSAVQLNAPFFRDFFLTEEDSGKIRLRWTQADVESIFPAEALSDGTLRYICLATLLLQPYPPALIALDEPELGLHPFAITQLADLIRSASTRTQVVIATQSVTLLDQFEPNDLVVVNRTEGSSTFERPDMVRLREWLEEYSLGELWQKNILGGRPRNESTHRAGA